MPGDPYYRTAHWLRLRTATLERDNHTCVIPGCGLRAKVVDHIIHRKRGGRDDMSNTRSLCRYHDNQLKELNGKRRRDVARVPGSNSAGTPNDPNHFWNK